MKKTEKSVGFSVKNFRVISLLWKLSKPFFFTSFLEHILRAFLPYVALYGASLLIDGISNGKSLQELLIVVYWMAGIAATGTVLQALLKAVNDSIQTKLQVSIKALLSKKTFSLSYSQCEGNETMRLVAAADEGANGSGDVGNYMVNMATLVEAITSIVFGLLFLWPLFSKVQTTTNEPLPLYLTSIWAPLTILGLVFLSTLAVGLLGLLANTISYKVMMDNVDGNRRFHYFYDISTDYEIGKDVRLYHLEPFLHKLEFDPKASVSAAWDKFSWLEGGFESIILFFNAVLACGSYLIVGLRAAYGFTSIGAVVSMVGAATLLSQGLTNFILYLGGMNLCANYLQNYFVYLKLPEAITYGDKALDLSQALTLEFKDVHFTYPGQKEETLKGLNLSIESGKRLAIVGLNGAGKTTLVKLLCRFYDPDSGEILLNGVPLKNYSQDALYSLYAVVFQDFKIFSYSLRQNIYCGLEGDEAKAIDALKRAGIYSRVLSFPQGLDTMLYQDNEENGVEISGGEAQKIAIARALYKDSPIIILDEPTAALDPKSEAEIYDDFAGLIKGKTAIFISHRMSSTRDSDAIAVIADGVVKELGNHKDLMKNPNGLYHQMWDAQAQYYR
jgi:ATP-binding cassette subfamily B protein